MSCEVTISLSEEDLLTLTDANCVKTERFPIFNEKYTVIERKYEVAHDDKKYTHSRITIIKQEDGENVLFDFQRLYRRDERFPVKKGDIDFLFVNRHFMKPTLLDLTHQKAYEDPATDEFCWTGVEISPDGNTLLVDGCYWACPYMFEFFDFTDPTNGWPRLQESMDTALVAEGNQDVGWVPNSTQFRWQQYVNYYPEINGGQDEDDIRNKEYMKCLGVSKEVSLEILENLLKLLESSTKIRRLDVEYILERRGNEMLVISHYESPEYIRNREGEDGEGEDGEGEDGEGELVTEP